MAAAVKKISHLFFSSVFGEAETGEGLKEYYVMNWQTKAGQLRHEKVFSNTPECYCCIAVGNCADLHRGNIAAYVMYILYNRTQKICLSHGQKTNEWNAASKGYVFLDWYEFKDVKESNFSLKLYWLKPRASYVAKHIYTIPTCITQETAKLKTSVHNKTLNLKK